MERMILSPKTSQGIAQHARIIFSLSEGKSVEQEAKERSTCTSCVYLWRSRYLINGVDGFSDSLRSGRPHSLNS